MKTKTKILSWFLNPKIFICFGLIVMFVASPIKQYEENQKWNHEHVTFSSSKDFIATVTGNIDDTTYELLNHWIKKNPKQPLIVFLESGGGKGTSAVKIAQLFQHHGNIHTIVKNECASACTLLWLAGTQRTVPNGAWLGFHGAYASSGDVDIFKKCLAPSNNQVVISIHNLDTEQEELFKSAEPKMASIVLAMNPYELHNESYVKFQKVNNEWIVGYVLSKYPILDKNGKTVFKYNYPILFKEGLSWNTYDSNFDFIGADFKDERSHVSSYIDCQSSS